MYSFSNAVQPEKAECSIVSTPSRSRFFNAVQPEKADTPIASTVPKDSVVRPVHFWNA